MNTKKAEEKRPRGRPTVGSPAHSAGYTALLERAQQMHLSSVTDWCKLILENKLPSPLPARPELEFPTKFESNPALAWKEFLSLAELPSQEEIDLLPDVDQRGYVEFEYAQEMARGLNLSNADDWYRKAGNLHPCCPREPWAVYFNKGFTSFDNFLGIAQTGVP